MKKVLVAPLNWGMGHATRCVPIIETLRELGAEVVLAGHGHVYDFFRNRFPEHELIMLPGHIVSYQARGRKLMLPVIKGLPGFGLSLYREHQTLKKIVNKYHIGFILSDNRYGLWHPEVPSVLMTHQINIRVNGIWKAGLPLVRLSTHWFFRHFNEIWIPDFPNRPGLAGNLSHPRYISPHYRYIGPLSRFRNPAPLSSHPHYDFLALISGPEPQRTIFENILIRLFYAGPYKTVILRGLPGNSEIIQKTPYLTLIPHLPDDELHELICHSKNLISRPGYSSLMDLMVLQRQAVLVPTPGQPEQEYLAYMHRNNPRFRIFSQTEIEVLKPENFIMQNSPSAEHLTDSGKLLKEACLSVMKFL
jgi:predicted glycosyltransferase